MIKSLGSLSAYVITSKIFLRPFSGFDGKVESDLTRLKRGVRYNSSLNHEECFYRALDDARMLDVFHRKFPTVIRMNLSDDLTRCAKQCADSASNYQKRMAAAKDQAERDYLAEFYNQMDELEEAYLFMDKIAPQAKAIMDSLLKKPSANVPWNQLTCLQFFMYDPVTNSFVETTEKG